MKVTAICALAALSLAAARVQLEGDISAPKTWTLQTASPESNDETTVYFFLRHKTGSEEQLEQILLDVSDPRSSRYGQHLSNEALRDLMTSPEASDTVTSWLSSHNVTQEAIKPTLVGDLLQVKLSVAQAETMFSTTLSRYSRTVNDQSQDVLRATSYSIPDEIADAVSLVGDLIHFPAEPRLPIQSYSLGRRLLGGGGKGKWENSCTGSSGSKCKGLVEPGVLKTRYKLPDSPTVASNSSVAVAEFQGQYYKDSDISKFSTACGVEVKVSRNQGKNEDSAGIESELDIEFIGAVSHPIPLTVWYQSEYSLLSWIQSVGSNASPDLIHSVSYGNDEVQQTSTKYMEQVNTQFQMIGAKGISVLFASGDQGVWGRSGRFGGKFHPDFPGASPYITAVGGTDFSTYDIGDETTWASGGGGFSDTFPRPSWQEDAVKGYLSSKDANLPESSYYNASGRGYPDVAALGGQKTPYCVATGGGFEGVAGTSASCPVVAGVFALLNNERLTAGKSPLGFLNPFIYQNAAAFNDVTSGTNNAGFGAGFTAIKGWDAATGMGTPNYEALAAAVKSLP